MEFYQVKKMSQWRFVVKLPLFETGRFKFKDKVTVYKYWAKKYVTENVDDYLFERSKNDNEFIFRSGFAPLILKMFGDKMDIDSISRLEGYFKSDFPKFYFNNLLRNQNDDVNTLLKSKRGLFQCYTSYGKTEVIATLSNWISNTRGESLLIVTASSASKDTVVNRILDLFGTNISEFSYESNINIVNINGFFRSKKYDPDSEYWGNVKWILADEVENCIPERFRSILTKKLVNVEYVYGFSATTDKKEAMPLRVDDGIEVLDNQNKWKKYVDIIGRNKVLIGFYSFTSVYSKPSKFSVKMINIRSTINFDWLDDTEGVYDYSEIIYDLFTDREMCNLLQSICFSKDLIYIPMPRLGVIDYWINNYFKRPDYPVMCISSRGYEVFVNGEKVRDLKLADARDEIESGKIRLIVGTRSSYNSLDFPSLNKIITLFSKSANVVFQAIGRATRSKAFEVYNIFPIKKAPIYSIDLFKRLKLIKEYYKDSSLTVIEEDERIYTWNNSPDYIHSNTDKCSQQNKTQ